MTSRFAFVPAGIALLLCSLACFGQENQRVEVFAGYSFQRLSTGQVSGANLDSLFGAPAGSFSVKTLLSGGNAELQYNVTPRYAVVFDASGYFGTPIAAASSSGYKDAPRAQSVWYLFGPLARFPKGKFTPFVRVMIGENYLRSNATEATAFFGTAATAATDGAFAAAAGGGLDWQVKKHWAVRLGQVDYLYTRHTAAHYGSALFGTDTLAGTANYQNTLRVSAGLVYSFGAQ